MVLLVHPGGPFWSKKDDGAWSIPKGEFTAEELPLDAARREFQEETGFPISGTFTALSPIRQAGGKIVHAVFAHEGPVTRLIYSKDGATLYSLGQDRVVKAWDAQRMVERKVYQQQPETVLSMALRPIALVVSLSQPDMLATSARQTVRGL